ncbi:MAG: sugar-binding protein [Micromonosporaceae bacterium]|nr:sugar-binding protein [Micromonosporaceae bacterium]
MRSIISALAMVVVLSLTGCGGHADSSSGLVGIALPTSSSDRWVVEGKSMVAEFKRLGYDSDLQYGENDIEAQIAQIEKMIDQDAKLLVIGSIDGSKLTEVLAKAAQRKIPVIAYDRLIRDTPNVDYYATFDNYMVGVLQASFIESRLGLQAGKGPFTIELFAGSPDDNNAYFFFDGAMAILRPYLESGRLVVRSGETAVKRVTTMRWDGEIAKTRMTGLLAAHYRGTRLDAVLSPYDGISRGIISALQFAGYGTPARRLPIVTGQDAEPASVKQIISGTQAETVFKDTRLLAQAAASMGDSMIRGQKPTINDTLSYDNGTKIVPAYLLAPVSVDQSNYRQILVDSGYYSAGDLGI